MKKQTILEVKLINANNVRVHVNPTAPLLKRLIENSDYNRIRISFDEDGNIYVWDAAKLTHREFSRLTGINSYDLALTNGKGGLSIQKQDDGSFLAYTDYAPARFLFKSFYKSNNRFKKYVDKLEITDRSYRDSWEKGAWRKPK